MSVTRPFTPTVPADVRDIFIRFDRNRSGRLDFAELRNALAALSVDCTNSQAAAVLKRYDGNKNGLLDLDEFSRLVKELRQHQWSACPPDVKDVFVRFDRNRSNRLDYRELRAALQELGLNTSHQHAATILQRFDRSGAGTLDVQEFANLVRQLKDSQLFFADNQPGDAISQRREQRRPALRRPQTGGNGGRALSQESRWAAGERSRATAFAPESLTPGRPSSPARAAAGSADKEAAYDAWLVRCPPSSPLRAPCPHGHLLYNSCTKPPACRLRRTRPSERSARAAPPPARRPRR